MKPSPRAEPRTRWGLPALILLAAFAARLYRLGDANVWWDEALAIWAVRKGLLGVTLWTASDVHPPLYFWSLWGWVQLMGESEFAMRALSLAFGVLTVAVVYSLGRLIAGQGVGSLAALLTGLARFHVWWSQEMRMYVLAGLLGTLSLYLFARWLRAEQTELAETRQKGPSSVLLLASCALCSAAALYTIYLTAVILLVENLAMLPVLLWPDGRRRGRLLARWVSAQLAILLCLGIWLRLSWGRMSSWSVSQPIGKKLFVQLYATLLTTGVSVNIEHYKLAVLFPWALVALGAVLVVIGWRRRQINRAQVLGALMLGLTVGLGGMLIYLATMPRGLFYVPRVEARYFLPFAPAFWLALAWSVVLIARRWRVAGWMGGTLLLALWLIFLPGHYERCLRDELQSMVRAIISQAEPGDVVLLNSGSRFPVFHYYYDAIPAPARPEVVRFPFHEDNLTLAEVGGMLEPIAQSHRRIWLAEVEVTLSDPERLTEKWLSEHSKQVLMLSFKHNVLHLYDPSGQPPTLAPGYPAQHPLNLPAGDGGMLQGWELPVRAYCPGETAHVALLWTRAPREPVALALRNRRGQVLLQRQADPSLSGAPQRQQFDFPIYASTPAGEYEIVLSPAPERGAMLGTLRVERTRPSPRAGPSQVALNARLGRDIVLQGYALSNARGQRPDQIAPGERLTLDLYWRAERKLGQDYRVFVHLLGQAHNPRTQGPVWGQHDSQPVDNGFPTSQWFEGETVVDRHTFTVGAGAPAGSYTIEVGLYAADGQRLSVTSPGGGSQGDRVLLDVSLNIK